MRRWSEKRDPNERQIVDALRKYGATVTRLSPPGEAPGLPDLLVGYGGQNILMEVKSGKTKLSAKQVSWHADWLGQVAVVRSAEEAMSALHNHAYKYRQVGILD